MAALEQLAIVWVWQPYYTAELAREAEDQRESAI